MSYSFDNISIDFDTVEDCFLCRILAGALKLDDENNELPQMSISYKPQKISPKSESTVSYMTIPIFYIQNEKNV